LARQGSFWEKIWQRRRRRQQQPDPVGYACHMNDNNDRVEKRTKWGTFLALQRPDGGWIYGTLQMEAKKRTYCEMGYVKLCFSTRKKKCADWSTKERQTKKKWIT
jgi:hypothetical protein